MQKAIETILNAQKSAGQKEVEYTIIVIVGFIIYLVIYILYIYILFISTFYTFR